MKGGQSADGSSDFTTPSESTRNRGREVGSAEGRDRTREANGRDAGRTPPPAAGGDGRAPKITALSSGTE
ncbi:hypothetical protein GCM10010378_17320 [Streptomyces viridochromogenes]